MLIGTLGLGMIAGLMAATAALFLGYPLLAALGFYAGTGMVITVLTPLAACAITTLFRRASDFLETSPQK